jgi:hypothetical protein
VNIREKINQHPRLATTIFGVLILSSLALAIQQNRASNVNPRFASRAYFSDDDGATYFVDSFLKPYPFDHNGNPAYRACVYRVGHGTPYVAYLERYTEIGAEAIAPLLGSTNLADQNKYETIRATELALQRYNRFSVEFIRDSRDWRFRC